MKQTLKVLVPVDFSACSETALGFAIQLANKTEAELHILNVLNIDSMNIGNSYAAMLDFDELFWRSRSRMKKFIQKVSDGVRSSIDAPPVIKTIIEIGRRPGATICDVAKRNQIHYMVLGTKGEKKVGTKQLGSVTSTVLKNVPCTVLAIPENSDFVKNGTIGYVADVSRIDLSEISRAIKFFSSLQPSIKCVHLNERQAIEKVETQELISSFDESELDVSLYALELKPEVKDVSGFIEKENISILAVRKPKRSLFLKSFAQKFARYTDVPLLVLNS